MSKFLPKAVGLLIAAGVLAAAVFVVNLVWFRPFSLNLFYEKVFITVALQNPELLTSIGIAEQFGYRRHNAHLDDASVAKADRDIVQWRAQLAELRAYDQAEQSPAQQLSTRVLEYFIQDQLDGERFRFHDYPVNQLFGVQNQTPTFLMEQHAIPDRRGAEDYIARLGEVGRKFDQVIEGLALRDKNGVLPPRFVVERVLAEMRAFAALPTLENPLYRNLATKVAALADVSAADKPVLLARGVQAIESSVVPAYQRLIAFHERQLPRATDDDGAWKLPEGDAYYAWRLRSETTSRMTPQQVHDLGVAEVARIEAEMAAILAAQNLLEAGETPAQALARLAKDARFLYPNTDEGRQAALAEFARMIEQQSALSRPVIGLVPKAPIEVRRVPEFKEKTAPGAYYTPPALDGSRPGIFSVNLRDMAEIPKFSMRTLAVHEGVPGHHFQMALAQQQQGGPTFRRVLPFTAYAEGWALYAEWLALEMGLYKDDPLGNLGRLQAEMLRAARLVVDTGLHYKRWTRTQAIAYMTEKTGNAEADVVSEVERYIVNPGQACAYKVGMLSLQAARQRAAKALGPRFDAQALKAFHDMLLGSGSLPLAILDEQVDAWIKSRTP
jgi:uncharacterized protein (DUF885 family)